MAGELLDPTRCPICGNPNACGMAAGEGSCWCFDAVLTPGVIDRIPSEARDVVCVCQACGTGASAGTAPRTGDSSS